MSWKPVNVEDVPREHPSPFDYLSVTFDGVGPDESGRAVLNYAVIDGTARFHHEELYDETEVYPDEWLHDAIVKGAKYIQQEVGIDAVVSVDRDGDVEPAIVPADEL